jgi:hypothetical protein
MNELRKLVTADPAFQNLTKQQEAELINTLKEHRAKKTTSVRASNTAASRDCHATLNRIFREVGQLNG